MRLAYVVNGYPAASHSFIRREILALERQGHEVLRVSIRGWDYPLPGEEDQRERAMTRYVLQGGFAPLLAAFLRVLLTRPVRLTKALALAWRVGYRSSRPLWVHFVYLVEACLVLRWVDDFGSEHLHAHFGTNSAEVAMLTHELGGPGWSFTAHGPDEFDSAAAIALPEKIRRSDFAVAVSSFGRSQLYRQVSHEYWSKIKVVRCGIDKGFHQDPADTPIVDNRLVCVGRLSEQKGQLLLVEAARRLSERGITFELVLVGDGDMRGEIERLVSSYRLGDSVRITGWLSNGQVREEILKSRAMVLPSFAEGLPVVIMEAMVLQRPVLSTFVAGIPELVRDGEHGWLVPAGDVEALVAAMANCLSASSEAITAMGEAARLAILECHDVDKEAGELARHISESVATRQLTA
ncbi:glycosyltransferase [Mycobacterium sp. CBMA271]|nr:colanic acid biosynthesis glycosyltransferase WcaL [Mycobacteroides sp. CBMA 326]MUM21321.1 glycosyltransferase [Mycobacteroides sp. CBMA 271]